LLEEAGSRCQVLVHSFQNVRHLRR
jgi:hypothetical protein